MTNTLRVSALAFVVVGSYAGAKGDIGASLLFFLVAVLLTLAADA